MKKQLLVKRHGHTEVFDPKKLYASVYAAALNAHLTDEEAEEIADKTLKNVKKQLKNVAVINSAQIKKLVINELAGTDVGFLYEHHMDIN